MNGGGGESNYLSDTERKKKKCKGKSFNGISQLFLGGILISKGDKEKQLREWDKECAIVEE